MTTATQRPPQAAKRPPRAARRVGYASAAVVNLVQLIRLLAGAAPTDPRAN